MRPPLVFCMVAGFFRLEGVHGPLVKGALDVVTALTDAWTALAEPPSGVTWTPGCADCPVWAGCEVERDSP